MAEYRHGVIDERLPATDQPLPADWALQDPQDYLDALTTAVTGAVAGAGVDPAEVVGIAHRFHGVHDGADARRGTPLCRLERFRDRPHAYVKLWRHHAAQPQADRINRLAADRGEPWLARYGGLISSEWEFAKGLELLEGDPEVYTATERWVEAADWIVWQLCGEYVRNACTAGYKGILQDGEYPSRDFLAALNDGFAGFVDDKLRHPLGGSATAPARSRRSMAAALGLPEGIAVAVGNVDAHVTAAAADAIAPGRMVAIMGTSTCHVMNGRELREVPGMCGVVDGGIAPGLWGYEAGQSGVATSSAGSSTKRSRRSTSRRPRRPASASTSTSPRSPATQAVGEHGLLALDWHSGNRSVLVNHELSGLIVGLTTTTKPRTSTGPSSRRRRSAPG